MGINMHLIRLDLIANIRQQHLNLRRRPTPKAREQRERIAIYRTIQKL